jgi:hypothetical protein
MKITPMMMRASLRRVFSENIIPPRIAKRPHRGDRGLSLA